jgi:hypothetical protein
MKMILGDTRAECAYLRLLIFQSMNDLKYSDAFAMIACKFTFPISNIPIVYNAPTCAATNLFKLLADPE